jgi:hypothetical protein
VLELIGQAIVGVRQSEPLQLPGQGIQFGFQHHGPYGLLSIVSDHSDKVVKQWVNEDCSDGQVIELTIRMSIIVHSIEDYEKSFQNHVTLQLWF